MADDYCGRCGVQLWLNGECPACPRSGQVVVHLTPSPRRLATVYCPHCRHQWEDMAAALNVDGHQCPRCGTLSEPLYYSDDRGRWARADA